MVSSRQEFITTGPQTSPELSQFRSFILDRLKHDNWILPEDLHSAETQFVIDARRQAFTINDEDFRNSPEYKKFIALEEKKKSTQDIEPVENYSEKQALADWVKRALFNNNEEAFKTFYDDSFSRDLEFNLFRSWSQPVFISVTSGMKASATKIKEVLPGQIDNDSSTIVLVFDWIAKFRYVDGKINVTLNYNQFKLKHQIKRNKNDDNPFKEDQIPGNVTVELELVPKGFQILKFSASNALLLDLITHDVVHVVEWLDRAKKANSNLELGIEQVASPMRSEFAAKQEEIYLANKAKEVKTQKEREAKQRRLAAEDMERKSKVEKYAAICGEYLATLSENDASQKQLILLLKEIIKNSKSDSSTRSKLDAIEIALSENYIMIGNIQTENSNHFVKQLNSINNKYFPTLAAADFEKLIKFETEEQQQKALKEILAEKQRKAAEEEAARKAAEENRLAAEEKQRLLAEDEAARVRAIKTVCEVTAARYLNKLVREITNEVKDFNKELAKYLKDMPKVKEVTYVELPGDKFKIETVDSGIDLLALDPTNDDERIKKFRHEIEPRLSESTKIALEKYRIFKKTEQTVNDENLSNSQKLRTVADFIHANDRILNIQRDNISDAFLKVIKFILPSSLAQKISNSSIFKAKTAQFANNIKEQAPLRRTR